MRKFILVIKHDDNTRTGILRFGDVAWHKDLLCPKEYCLGGGSWTLDPENKTLELYDMSGDFGMPKFEYADQLAFPDEFKEYNIWYRYPFYMNKENKIINKL